MLGLNSSVFNTCMPRLDFMRWNWSTSFLWRGLMSWGTYFSCTARPYSKMLACNTEMEISNTNPARSSLVLNVIYTYISLNQIWGIFFRLFLLNKHAHGGMSNMFSCILKLSCRWKKYYGYINVYVQMRTFCAMSGNCEKIHWPLVCVDYL